MGGNAVDFGGGPIPSSYSQGVVGVDAEQSSDVAGDRALAPFGVIARAPTHAPSSNLHRLLSRFMVIELSGVRIDVGPNCAVGPTTARRNGGQTARRTTAASHP